MIQFLRISLLLLDRISFSEKINFVIIMDKLNIKHTYLLQNSSASVNTYYIGCKAEELKEMLKKWDVPLGPNPRRPSRNFITESIVSDIRKGKLLLLPEFHVYAHEVYERGGRNVVLDFGVGGRLFFGRSLEEERFYGFIKGGHRLLALRHAMMAGLEIGDIDIKLNVYQGCPYSEIKKIAVQLNTVYRPITPHREQVVRKRKENSFSTK